MNADISHCLPIWRGQEYCIRNTVCNSSWLVLLKLNQSYCFCLPWSVIIPEQQKDEHNQQNTPQTASSMDTDKALRNSIRYKLLSEAKDKERLV